MNSDQRSFAVVALSACIAGLVVCPFPFVLIGASDPSGSLSTSRLEIPSSIVVLRTAYSGSLRHGRGPST